MGITNKLNVSSINPNQILNTLQSELHSSIEDKQASIVLNNIPTQINADSVKLKQVFQNLIANALKFTSPSVSPLITISCAEGQRFWKFTVNDNGIGIALEFQEKIFLLFKRLHTNDVYEGTGIGLSLCKKLVEQHNGEIGVTSQQGKGSTFYFTIDKTLEMNKE